MRNLYTGLIILGLIIFGAREENRLNQQLAEAQEEIEYLTSMIEEDNTKTLEIEELTAYNEDLHERNNDLTQQIAELRKQLEEQQPAVEEPEVVEEEPIEIEEPVVEETEGYYIADNNDYYHDYSDCPFIANKTGKTTTHDTGDRHACKCIYQGEFWK